MRSPRARNQNGQLIRGARHWSGRFRIYEKRARGGWSAKRKMIVLGPVSISQEEAAALLRSRISEEQQKRDHLAFIGLTEAGPLAEMHNRQKGIIAEMLVITDLTRKGFEIYRHVADLAPCDVLALRDGKVLRVEVKYAGCERSRRYISRDGRFDVLAVVSADESIEYCDSVGEKLGVNWAVTGSVRQQGPREDSVSQ